MFMSILPVFQYKSVGVARGGLRGGLSDSLATLYKAVRHAGAGYSNPKDR
jgi:hypothetical protein